MKDLPLGGSTTCRRESLENHLNGPYSSVDCIVDVQIFFIILAFTSDSEFSTRQFFCLM